MKMAKKLKSKIREWLKKYELHRMNCLIDKTTNIIQYHHHPCPPGMGSILKGLGMILMIYILITQEVI